MGIILALSLCLTVAKTVILLPALFYFFQWVPWNVYVPSLPQCSQLVPSSHSSLLYSRASVSHRRELLHASGALIFAITTQGKAFDGMALENKAVCISGSYGTETILKIVLGSLPPWGHCMDRKQKHTVVFIWNKSICLFMNFGLRGRLLVWHTCSGLWSDFRE